jgi:hypothetical protein
MSSSPGAVLVASLASGSPPSAAPVPPLLLVMLFALVPLPELLVKFAARREPVKIPVCAAPRPFAVVVKLLVSLGLVPVPEMVDGDGSSEGLAEEPANVPFDGPAAVAFVSAKAPCGAAARSTSGE